MKSICIDCRYVGARPSGIGEMVQGLIRHIPEIAPEQHFLFLKNANHVGALSDAPNVTEHLLSASANGPGTMWWLSQLVDLSRVDLFHATANILPARLPMATLTTIHDIMWLTHPEWCNPSLYGVLERGFYGHGIRRAIARSTRIAALSEATRRSILEHSPDAAERVSVVHSGVADRFRPIALDPTHLERLGLRAGQRFVLTVGQYAPYKNHEGALRAFAASLNSMEDIAYVFVQRQGKGAQELLGLARELGVERQLRILNVVAPEDLLQLYNSAEALLHPSLAEGFGNPVVEAMACGCPVITSNRSAMPEVSGGAARLIDPFDTNSVATALREVVSDPSTRGAMREAGLARVRSLTWRKAAAKYVDLYREILKRA